jgi:probable rRNA maturation factor
MTMDAPPVDPEPEPEAEPQAQPDAPRLTISARAGRDLEPWLHKHLDACLDVLAEEAAVPSVSVALVGDKVMGELHARFHGDPAPTDVLTFELDHDADGRCTGGEVVVCVPQARRSGRERGVDVGREALLYALHGVLHLMGYDDQNRADFDHMHAKEDAVLAAIGVGATFKPAGDSSEAA